MAVLLCPGLFDRRVRIKGCVNRDFTQGRRFSFNRLKPSLDVLGPDLDLATTAGHVFDAETHGILFSVSMVKVTAEDRLESQESFTPLIGGVIIS